MSLPVVVTSDNLWVHIVIDVTTYDCQGHGLVFMGSFTRGRLSRTWARLQEVYKGFTRGLQGLVYKGSIVKDMGSFSYKGHTQMRDAQVQSPVTKIQMLVKKTFGPKVMLTR